MGSQSLIVSCRCGCDAICTQHSIQNIENSKGKTVEPFPYNGDTQHSIENIENRKRNTFKPFLDNVDGSLVVDTSTSKHVFHDGSNVSVDNDRLNPTLQYEWILTIKTEKQMRSLSLLIKDKQRSLSIHFLGVTDELKAFLRNVSKSTLRKGTKIEVKLVAHLLKEVENQLGKTIKSLHSDRGGEYMSQEFLDHLKEHGIIAHRTPPYTPQHNGVSERRNRTLLDMVRSMMSQTTLPKSFWDYALEFAARILNMVLTTKVEKTSYEIYYPPENKVFVTRNAEFFKNSLITQEAGLLGIHVPQIECIYTFVAEEHELGVWEPANYKAALLDPELNKWLDAMNVEMKSMKDNKFWDLVDLPPNGKNVAKGFTQTYRVDYEETFSLVADIRAIRTLIAIVAFYDYEIWQMDVKLVPSGHLS
ncbi:retrotransposon protein, putative, ty1-copia subclass [Tanacetum coccineum]